MQFHICSYFFFFFYLVWKQNKIPNTSKTLTMLYPTVLAAPFALMSSYYLSVGHVSWLPPSLLDLRFQINHQMKETLLQRNDVLAAELWIQSKNCKSCAPYNNSHQKQPQRGHYFPLFSAVTLSIGDWTGTVSVRVPVADRKLESGLESRSSISTIVP